MIPATIYQEAELRYTLSPRVGLDEVHGPVHELLGFAAEDFLSSNVSLIERIHPHDSDVAEVLFSPAGEADSGTCVLRVRHAGGRIRCLQVHFTKKSEDTRVVLCLRLQSAGSVWDDPFVDNAAHFRTMVDHTDEQVFFKDRNHVFIAASAAFRAQIERFLNGRSVVGLTDYDFLPEADADTFYAAEQQALKSGIPCDVLHEMVRGAETNCVNSRYREVRGKSGEVMGLFATVHAVTTHLPGGERTEGTARTHRIGGYVLDLRRGVSTTSATVDAMFGIDKSYPHDIEGWSSLVHPEDRDRMMEYLRSVLEASDGLFNMDYRIVRRSDGEVRWVHGLGRVDRGRDGTPMAMRGTIEDITERKDTEAALLKSKERLQMFIEHAPAALAMFDREMRYVAVSRRWLDITGTDSENVLGRNHYDVFPELPEKYRDTHVRGLAGEAQRCDEDRQERSDGTVQWVRWEILPWRTDEGDVGGIILFLEDITKAKESEQRLQLAASVFEHATEAIVVTDLNGAILEINDAFTRMTGYSREESVGQRVDMLKSDLHDEVFYAEMSRSIVEGGRWRGELWNRAKDGRAFPASTTITTVRSPLGEAQYYVSLFFDISPMKEQEQKLERIAHFDALTGLPNRALLGDRLRSAMTAARDSNRMLAVIFIDLDNFKAVNDRQGKDTADALLVSVAGRMKHVLREGDTLGRLGGDEFVAILPDLSNVASATSVIDRLLQAAGEAQCVGGHELRISATAGATFYPQSQDVDADQLLRQADQAMYEAKLAGKGRYHNFDPVRDHTVRGRHEELARIRQALNAGEFELYYQPKVNMATGELVGAEALIRWRHPERGLLPPLAFLPVIEDDPLAIDVGDWVIDTALAQVERWAQSGHRIRASVNVSAKQLEQPNFIERLSAVLARHPDVSPSMLELEVLESSALRDVAMVSDVIQACNQMGMRVAIDDFGTGYSSLTYLKRLPAGVLKIDQSFVRDMLDDAEDLAILQGIMGLATAFGRLPVAEGVESVGHGVVLLKLGCEVAQGYGIARPMPADDLFRWYAAWRPDPSWRNVVPLSPLDWPVLTAEVEQGAWVRALVRYLKDESANPPELDEKLSRFGQWLENERRNPRSTREAIAVMELLHRRSHRLARRAVALKRRGRASDAAALTAEVLKVREEMQVQFDSTLRNGFSGMTPTDGIPVQSVRMAPAVAKLQ
jgi:diguanylate cyclase (GGDEF)-like protein/PAS domain S-box-containing protein